MKRLPVFVLLFFLNLELNGQLVEKTYLKTDKDLYQPGDTLWFKGYVFNRENLISDQSLDFHVFLHNEEGIKQADTSWPIIKGMAPGYLVLPLEEGRFFLTGISPNMLNMSHDLSFRKEIFIRSGGIDVIRLKAETNQKVYSVGDELTVHIHAALSEKEVAAKERFRYIFFRGDQVIQKGVFRTSELGDYELGPFEVPFSTDPLRLLISKTATEFTPSVNLSLPILVDNTSIDLRFFPEGGQLMAEANNTVAFKALKPNGKPAQIKALIINDQNEVIDSIATQYEGMGSFTLRPGLGTYYARISEPMGIDSLYQLPTAETTGLTINLTYSDQDTLVKVMTSTDLVGKHHLLSVWQHDRLVHQMEFKASSIQFFKPPFSKLDFGIARLHVTDVQGNVLSERLLFLKNDLQLKVAISLNKDEYLPRDKVEAIIKVTDEAGKPVIGNFTFSAVDDTYAPMLNKDQPGLMAHLLLNSELKGNVPTPNFYFENTPKASEALDLVMLTHGWRKYELHSQVDHSLMTGELLHRKRKKKKLTNREISIFNTTNYTEEIVVTDETGRFEIPSHHFKYKGDSFIVASRAEGKREKPNMMIDTHTKEALGEYKSVIGAFVDSSYFKDYQVFEMPNKLVQDRFGNTALLNAIDVISEKTGSDCEGNNPIFKNSWKKKTRGELNLDDLDPISLFKQVSYKVSHFGFVSGFTSTGRSYRYGPGSLISMEKHKWVYNGEKIQVKFTTDMTYWVYINCERVAVGPNASTQEALSNIDLSNVESISILDPIDLGPNPKSILFGQVEIHTIDDKVIYKPAFKKFFTYTTNTAQAASFYQMKYETKEARQLPIPDLRTTIHWEHTVITDENGEAKIEFYNADRDNRIRITVEGLGAMQRFGFAQKDYRVLMPASLLSH